MQLYVIENVCAQLLVLKASRSSNKLKKKTRIHQKGDLCNSLRIKLLRLEGEHSNHTTKQTSTTKSRHMGFLYFLIAALSWYHKLTSCHYLWWGYLCSFVYTTLDTLCNCIEIHVIKVLSSVRMLMKKKQFLSYIFFLFSFFVQAWKKTRD